MRCALYARVSTKDRQEVENQLVQLRRYAEARGWALVHEYVDKESGKTAKRSEFQALFAAAAGAGIRRRPGVGPGPVLP